MLSKHIARPRCLLTREIDTKICNEMLSSCKWCEECPQEILHFI